MSDVPVLGRDHPALGEAVEPLGIARAEAEGRFSVEPCPPVIAASFCISDSKPGGGSTLGLSPARMARRRCSMVPFHSGRVRKM